MVFSACHIWTLFTCYLHMYMSSTHYLGICILCTHYLQWSLIYSFLTDNADVIHMSSLVLFIYPIMYNLVSAHCLHRRPHVIRASSAHRTHETSVPRLFQVKQQRTALLKSNSSYLLHCPHLWKVVPLVN